MWEWCCYFRFSPAWIDDQRCEQFNLRWRRYWTIFSSAYSEVNLLKMANTMIRKSQGGTGDCGLVTTKQTNALLTCVMQDYYTRRVPCNNIPLLSTDSRYRRIPNLNRYQS